MAAKTLMAIAVFAEFAVFSLNRLAVLALKLWH